MIKLKIRYLCIMTLMVATIAFYSVKNDVLAKTTGGGPSYSEDESSDDNSHDIDSSDDDSSGSKKKNPKKEWRTDGNANIDHDIHFLGTTEEADLVLKANNEEKMRVTTEGVVAGTDPSILSLDVNGLIRIRGGAPWAGFVLTAVDSDGNAIWQSISVNDADSDPFNELQTLSQSGNSVTLSNSGGTISVADNDDDNANEIQILSRQVGSDNVILSNGGGTVSIADNDSDITNEFNTSAILNGSSLEITDAGGTLSVNLGSIGEETDPIYNAWDKSTGISVTESQVSDLSHFTNTDESDPTVPASVKDGTDWTELTSIPADIADGDDGITTEADPVYDAWDKSAGISITESQVSDLNHFTNADETDPTVDLPKLKSLVTDNFHNLGGVDQTDDADADPTNEIQAISKTGTDVTLSIGGGTVSVADNDNDSSNENNSAVLLTGTTLKVTDAGGTLSADLVSLRDDADADSANELNTGASLSGTELKITDAGGTLAVDLSSLSSGGGLWNTVIGGINYSSGKVGIGTTTPSSELEVNGRVESSRLGYAGTYDSAQVQGIWSIGSDWGVNVGTNDFGTQYGITYAHTNAGTSGSKKPIVGWGHQILFTSGGIRKAAISLSSGNGYFAGNVGVGTTSPSAKLDVVGVLELSNVIPTDPGSDIVRLGDGGRNLRIQTNYGYTQIGPENTSWSYFSTDRPRFYFNKGITVDQGLIGSYNENLTLQTSGTTRITVLNTNGNVGIGTTAPGAKLDCRGSAIFNEGSSDSDFRVESNGRTHALFVDAGNDVVRVGQSAGSLSGDGTTVAGSVVDYVADFDKGGATGTAIGIGSIEYLLDGSAETLINNNFGPTTHLNKDLGSSTRAWDDVYADNFVNISDGREKKFISDMKYGLKEIKAMRNVSYVLKKDPSGKKRLGLIAQDVLKLVPEAVKTHDLRILDEAHPDVYTEVEVETLGVSYSTLIPVLIKATQEQNELIMKQQAELNLLKKQVQLLLTRK